LIIVAAGVAISGQGDGAAGVALVVVGAGMFFIGTVMPTLTEFQIGPGGFSAKLRERDADFEAVIGPDAEQLTRLGTWLAGGPAAGRDLAERALIETYMRWPRERADNPANAVRERMVELAPPAGFAPPATAQAPAGTAGDLLSRLISLPVTERAAVVLNLLEGLDTETVASITRREPAAVAVDIARGATSIVSGATPPAGAAW
jgi:hypothetical protein